MADEVESARLFVGCGVKIPAVELAGVSSMDGQQRKWWLRFCDHLRADAALARRYAEPKHELAQRFLDDREAYTAGKADFVRDARDGQAFASREAALTITQRPTAA
jgi:hypothetical protein